MAFALWESEVRPRCALAPLEVADPSMSANALAKPQIVSFAVNPWARAGHGKNNAGTNGYCRAARRSRSPIVRRAVRTSFP